MGVQDQLPIEGIDLILGNDLAGGKVFLATPEVTECPTPDILCHTSSGLGDSTVFPACVVTRAQARLLGDVVDISEMFLDGSDSHNSPSPEVDGEKSKVFSVVSEDLCLAVNREQLVEAQQSDDTLSAFRYAALQQVAVPGPASYQFDHGVLLRKWTPVSGLEGDVVTQVVVPTEYRPQFLSLAHEHHLSGHLGIRKTYDRVLRYFFFGQGLNLMWLFIVGPVMFVRCLASPIRSSLLPLYFLSLQ